MEEPGNGNENAAVVQLFYWCNWMHDRLYQLGFTEAAGNFQFENVFDGVDRGGVAGDPLLADAQRFYFGQPSFGIPPLYNNAGMSTPPDGESPYMSMLVFNYPEPDRDPDLDAEIILHEYTHGLSNRRVGNGTGIDQFQLQTRGLGEGWSDFMALALLSEEQDDLGGNWAAGGYTTFGLAGLQENYYYGIRRYPYSTNLTKNPLTFKDIDPTQADAHTGIPHSPIIGGSADEIHNVGEVWCVALWEMRRNLILKPELEFGLGNPLALQLVVDGMNLAPPNPTFIQARDAILLADQVANGGVNAQHIWAAFAKRGMGYSAAAPGSRFTLGVVENYDLPPASPELWTYNAGQPIYSSPALGPDGTVYFGSYDGKLHALNRDGSKKWDVSLGSTGWNSLDSSPAVGPDGDIYIATFGYDSAAFGRMYAVRPDGSIKWSYTLIDWIESSPAIGADGTVYFGSWDGNLYALNPDGTLKWTYYVTGVTLSSPAIDKDGVIYVGAIDSKLYAINPNGTLKWTTTATDWIFSSPVIDWSGPANADPANGTVYFASYAGTFYAVNTSDGSIRWQYQTGGPIIASPGVDTNGNVYIGSEDGRLYCLNSGGGLRFSYQAGAPIDSSPALGWANRVYFAANDGKLYVLRTDVNGDNFITSFQMGADSFSSPAIGSDGRIYIGCSDSKLYVYPAETLLMPSSWPMFRNDPRHLGNQGLIWFDGGSLLADGSFWILMHSSIYPVQLKLEWSNNLKDWNLRTYLRIGYQIPTQLTYGRGSFQDVDILGHECIFYRVNVANFPFLQSRNPYGFVKIIVPPGGSLIANPLNTRTNTLSGLIPNPPAGTTFYKFNSSSQTWSVYFFDEFDSVWTGDPTLLPGEGGLIVNPTDEPFVVTIIGEVLQGHLSAPLPSAFSIRGSMVPQAGGLSSLLGLGPEDGLATGDNVLRHINQRGDYVTYTYNTASGWSRTDPSPSIPRQPRPEVGEAVFFNLLAPRTWTRYFSVWP